MRPSSSTNSGEAKKIIINKDNTTIIEGAGKKSDITGRAEQIKAQIDKTTSDYDREKLQERHAKLVGGVAIIHVGGATEVAMKDQKDRRRRCPPRHPAAAEEGYRPRRRRRPAPHPGRDRGRPEEG